MFLKNSFYFSDKNIISYYIAISVVLQIVDNMIPYPIVGVKLGLANIVPLFVLNSLGFMAAFQVAFFRPIVCAILLGSFGSSMFVISFLSSVCSIILMSGTKLLFEKFLSNIGISIVGAVGHNLCQLFIVYFLFINNKAIFMLFPILIFAGVIFGFITGYIVNTIFYSLPEKFSFDTKQFLNNPKFLQYNICSQNFQDFKENYYIFYILIPFAIISIIIVFGLIKNVVIIIAICLFLLIKKYFTFQKNGSGESLLKSFSRKKFFVYIVIGIIFTNLFSFILYNYTIEQTVDLLKNIFISLLKLLTFVLLAQELFKLRYVNNLLKNFPLIFRSIEFVNVIMSEIEIKGKFKIIDFLKKLLVKDVFLY